VADDRAQRLAVAPRPREVDDRVEVQGFDVKQHWHARYHEEPCHRRWLHALVAELFTPWRRRASQA